MKAIFFSLSWNDILQNKYVNVTLGKIKILYFIQIIMIDDTLVYLASTTVPFLNWSVFKVILV